MDDKIYLLNNEVPQEAIIIMKTSRQRIADKINFNYSYPQRMGTH